MAETAHPPDLEIQALLDGGLDDRAERAARSHLATCAACARRLQAQARLFARIESWEEAAPPHDLAPLVLDALHTPAVPVGLRWATALQAGLVLLVVALGWPLIAGLARNVRLPSLALPTMHAIGVWLGESSALIAALRASLLPSPDTAGGWLRLAPNEIAIWPAVVAGAALVALVGNSILLSGTAGNPPVARARRL